MKAGILAIGTELLMGKTLNTNAYYLSQQLSDLGISVFLHYTVGDNPNRIKQHLINLLEVCDIVFTTGGLGPTLDDITKEIVAETLEIPLVLDDHSLERIKARFKLFSRTMPESNIRQAYFPKGAVILDNDQGTAPACIVETELYNASIIVLPGPPKELKHIFDRYIRDYLCAKNQQSMVSKYLSIYDLGESAVEEQLMELIENQTNPTLATYAGEGKVLLRITSSGLGAETDLKSVNEMVERVRDKIGSFIVSEQGDDLELVLLNQLKAQGLKIAFAESCTGGLLGYSLIKYSGASETVDSILVTYTNEAKIRELNVKPETLSTYGAVSHQTCYEMVKGIVEKTGVDIGVSITGIAGPTGGSDEKPVGLVYIGLYYKGEIFTTENHIYGDREGIQRRTAMKALKMIFDLLNEN